MSSLTRIALIIIGLGMMVVGLTVVILPSPDRPGGLMLLAMGAALVVLVVIERQRYRSQAAEAVNAPPGPGGGEPFGSLEPRFRQTNEVFVDPTSGARMRVFVDPANGERRYVAEA